MSKKKDRGLRIIAWFVKAGFHLKYNLCTLNAGEVKKIKPPYLLVANHGNNWDPFIVSSAIHQPMNFLASDAVFRNPVIKIVLFFLGAVPKKKFMRDMNAIKRLFYLRDQGEVLAMFPEANATWDGASLPITPATGKLIKRLGIPVVAANITGNYLSRPRWTRYSKKGRITIRYKQVFTPDQLHDLDPSEINTIIARHIQHDEYVEQAKNPIRFRGRRRAEYLERTLFSCPVCHRIGTMRSRKNKFACQACGYELYYNEFGLFETLDKDEPVFKTIREWNVWQQEYLRTQLDMEIRDEDCLLSFLSKGEVGQQPKLLGNYTILCRANELEFIGGDSRKIPISEIDGLNIQNKERLEFYYDSCLYNISFRKKWISSYKWYSLLRLKKENTDNE